MFKRFITYLLLFSFLNYIGCSSTYYVAVDEYRLERLEEDPPVEIFITTNDNQKYHFSNREFFYFKGGVLYGRTKMPEYTYEKGKAVPTGKMKYVHGKLTPSEIESIEEIGPDEIIVTAVNGKEFHFINNGYYFIKNDTLYGKSKMDSDTSGALTTIKISVSNIKSVHSGLQYHGEDTVEMEEKLEIEKEEAHQGIEITVLLKNGRRVYGELLYVRDSSIIICTETSATEEELKNNTYPLITVSHDKIQEIMIEEGHSYVIMGAAAGLLGGILVGSLVSYIILHDDKSDMVGLGYAIITLAGIVLGFLAGVGIGAANSTDDLILNKFPLDYDFSVLAPLARYTGEAPEFLKNN